MERRFIDANALIENLQELYERHKKEWNETNYDYKKAVLGEAGKILFEVIRRIKGQPTIDAFELVRCKDCYHCTKSMWCNLLMMDVEDWNYCYNGERRKEDDPERPSNR